MPANIFSIFFYILLPDNDRLGFKGVSIIKLKIVFKLQNSLKCNIMTNIRFKS